MTTAGLSFSCVLLSGSKQPPKLQRCEMGADALRSDEHRDAHQTNAEEVAAGGGQCHRRVRA